jgi:hypothetical protein
MYVILGLRDEDEERNQT